MRLDLIRPLQGKERVNFLHIGKTGGSQIKNVLKEHPNKKCSFKVWGHRTKLLDLPESQDYFFSVRDPVSRYLSAFYYRKNKGLPGVFQEWSPGEKLAFQLFDNPSDLAEALFLPSLMGMWAAEAMQSIAHVAAHQIDWFERFGFLSIRPPIAIIRQENLAADLDKFLKNLLGFSNTLSGITKDENVARINNYPVNSILSTTAKKNIEKWYCRDVIFYESCCEWIENNKKGDRAL